jgi:hypothetical protein
MLKNKNADVYVSLVVFVIGTFLGAYMQESIKNFQPTHVVLLAILTAQLVWIHYLQLHKKSDIKTIREIHDSIKNLEEKIGLEVYYQDIESLNKEKSLDQDKLAQVIRGSQREILILDLNDTEKKRDDAAVNGKLQSDYFNMILQHSISKSSGGKPFIYERICQFSPAEARFSDMGSLAYTNHCHQMAIQREKEENIGIYLRKTRVRYPMTFKIIDREYLVLHITDMEYLEEGKVHSRLLGEIIIHDPEKLLIDVFLKTWDVVKNSVGTSIVSSSEVIPLDSSRVETSSVNLPRSSQINPSN